MPKETLTVTDNRTGKSYELPITDGTIRALDLRQIKVASEPNFLDSAYDPAYQHRAPAGHFIDGDKGILRYRYDVAELAESCTWKLRISSCTASSPIRKTVELHQRDYGAHVPARERAHLHRRIRHDVHPMGVLIGTVGALSTFYPESKGTCAIIRVPHMIRLMAKMPTIAAWSTATRAVFIYPDNTLSYQLVVDDEAHGGAALRAESGDRARARRAVHPARASRENRSILPPYLSLVDPYSATAVVAAAAPHGRHGGANEAVLRMLMEIGSAEKVLVKEVKEGTGEQRLMASATAKRRSDFSARARY